MIELIYFVTSVIGVVVAATVGARLALGVLALGALLGAADGAGVVMLAPHALRSNATTSTTLKLSTQ